MTRKAKDDGKKTESPKASNNIKINIYKRKELRKYVRMGIWVGKGLLIYMTTKKILYTSAVKNSAVEGNFNSWNIKKEGSYVCLECGREIMSLSEL